MEYFSIGFLSFAASAFLGIAYFLGYYLRRAAAWMDRRDQPGDRVFAKFILFIILGFIVGCALQTQWNNTESCRSSQRPLISCLFTP